MDADPRRRLAAVDLRLQSHRPVGERHGVAGHDHHLVAERLDHARVVRQRLLDGLDEALGGLQRLLVATLDGQARIASQVGKRDRDPQAPLFRGALDQLCLHVPDHVLLDEVRQVAVVDVAHERHHERDQLAHQLLHLLGDLHARHALAHQRLVHVQMDQAHLRVGDLG